MLVNMGNWEISVPLFTDYVVLVWVCQVCQGKELNVNPAKSKVVKISAKARWIKRSALIGKEKCG